jgi:hypothetical protein
MFIMMKGLSKNKQLTKPAMFALMAKTEEPCDTLKQAIKFTKVLQKHTGNAIIKKKAAVAKNDAKKKKQRTCATNNV